MTHVSRTRDASLSEASEVRSRINWLFATAARALRQLLAVEAGRGVVLARGHVDVRVPDHQRALVKPRGR